MELINLQPVDPEKSNVFLGEYEGQNYIRKTCKLSYGVGEKLMWVSSPYVAKIFEYGSDYMIMEYIEGTPLNDAKILTKEIYGIAIELCDGLMALHEKNIIHRDIKPSNIILTNERHIKIIDFDAARIKKPTADKDTSFIGTDGFAPPEQYGFMQTDERSDIYALGVTIKLLLKDAYERSPYRSAVEKCLRFNPEQRYSSVKAVKTALTLCHFRPVFISSAAVLCAAVGIALAVSGSFDLTKPALDAGIDSAAEIETPTRLQDVVVPEKSERNYPWDILSLPEGFPQLSESVTHFNLNYEGYTFLWDTALSSEAEFISGKLSEWLGAPLEKSYDDSDIYEKFNIYSFQNDDCEIRLIHYPNNWQGHKQMQLYIETENLPPVFSPEKRDWTVPENNQRNIPWSELELPEGFPQLAESVVSFKKEGAFYKIDFGEASPWEAVEMADKFCENGGELSYQGCDTNGTLSWNFLDDFGDANIVFYVSSSTHMGKTEKVVNLSVDFRVKR